MSEKDNKFILGDNSDGYRRSVGSEKTQPFALPPQYSDKKVNNSQRQNVQRSRQRPQQRPQQKPVRPSQRPGQRPVSDTRRSSGGQAMHRRETGRGDDKSAAMSRNDRKRQHNERRRRQRRNKQIVTSVAVVFVIIAVALVLSLTVFFKINEIVIKGDSRYTDEEIIAASGIEIGENIIMCGADEVSAKLAKALPYISSATVERTASGTVTINIKKAVPKWAFMSGENAVLTDGAGKVLEVGDANKATQAALVQGTTVTSAVSGEQIVLSEELPIDTVIKLGVSLSESKIYGVTALDITDIDYVKVTVEGRLTVIVGSMDNLDSKLALARKVIERENEIDPDQFGTVDLTVDGKAYFRPEAAPQLPEEETSGEADGEENTQEQSNGQT